MSRRELFERIEALQDRVEEARKPRKSSGAGKKTKLGTITSKTTIGELRKRLIKARAGKYPRLRGVEVPGPTRHRYSVFFHLPLSNGAVAISQKSMRASYDEDGEPSYATYGYEVIKKPDRMTVAKAIEKLF